MVASYICWCGGMADAADSKSVDSNIVRVQVPLPAPLMKGRIFMSKTNKTIDEMSVKIKEEFIDLDDIQYALKHKDSDLYDRYHPVVEKPSDMKKYPEGYVFDADKSVNWNREEVIRINKAVDRERKAYYKKLNSGYDTLISDVKNVIKTSTPSFNDKQIDYIIDYAKDVSVGMYELMDKIISLVDFADSLNSLAD